MKIEGGRDRSKRGGRDEGELKEVSRVEGTREPALVRERLFEEEKRERTGQ